MLRKNRTTTDKKPQRESKPNQKPPAASDRKPAVRKVPMPVKITSAVTSNQAAFDKFKKKSVKLGRKAEDASRGLTAVSNVTSVIQSLSGAVNPSPDFVAANAPLAERIAHIAMEQLCSITLRDPPPTMGIVSLATGNTPLDAAKVHLDKIGRIAGRVFSKVGGNYLALTTIKKAPTSQTTTTLNVGVKGVVWGPGTKFAYEAVVADLAAKSRDAAGMTVEWIDGDLAKMADFLADGLRTPDLKKAKAVGKAGRKAKASSGQSNACSLALFALLSLLDRKQMIFAGGEGKAVKGAVIKAAGRWLAAERTGPLPIHPDTVFNFWVTVRDELDGAGFDLPLITHRSVPSARRTSAPKISLNETEDKPDARVRSNTRRKENLPSA